MPLLAMGRTGVNMDILLCNTRLEKNLNWFFGPSDHIVTFPYKGISHLAII